MHAWRVRTNHRWQLTRAKMAIGYCEPQSAYSPPNNTHMHIPSDSSPSLNLCLWRKCSCNIGIIWVKYILLLLKSYVLSIAVHFFLKQHLVAHPVNIFILFIVCWGNIIIKSQTHWGWKRPSRSLNPTLGQIVAIGSMFSHLLNSSRDSDSTTSCGSPLQSLTFSQSLILLIQWILPDVLPNLNLP